MHDWDIFLGQKKKKQVKHSRVPASSVPAPLIKENVDMVTKTTFCIILYLNSHLEEILGGL